MIIHGCIVCGLKQCCARLPPENRARELRGLIAAAKLPGGPPKKGRELLILTLDQEDSLTEQGQAIRILPAWKWLDGKAMMETRRIRLRRP